MRLTKAIRESIKDIVINKTFEKREIALAKRKSELFRQIINSLLPKNFAAACADKRKTWFPGVTRIEIRVNEGGPGWEKYSFSGDAILVPFYLVDDYPHWKIERKFDELSPSIEIRTKVAKHLQTQKKLESDKQQLEKEISKILLSATTVKKLKEIWPEVETYYKFPEPTKNLPMVISSDDLNQTIEQMAKAA